MPLIAEHFAEGVSGLVQIDSVSRPRSLQRRGTLGCRWDDVYVGVRHLETGDDHHGSRNAERNFLCLTDICATRMTWSRTPGSKSVHLSTGWRGMTRTCPLATGSIVKIATQVSSAHTNRPGIWPSIIISKTVLMETLSPIDDRGDRDVGALRYPRFWQYSGGSNDG